MCLSLARRPPHSSSAPSTSRTQRHPQTSGPPPLRPPSASQSALSRPSPTPSIRLPPSLSASNNVATGSQASAPAGQSENSDRLKNAHNSSNQSQAKPETTNLADQQLVCESPRCSLASAPPQSPSSSLTERKASSESSSELPPLERTSTQDFPTSPSYSFQSFLNHSNPHLRLRSLGGIGLPNAAHITGVVRQASQQELPAENRAQQDNSEPKIEEDDQPDSLEENERKD